MNLYKLDSAIEQIINNGFVEDEETGEILFDSDNLDELEQTRAEKVENIALWIKNNESLSSAIREEEAALSARRKALDKKAQILKDYLLNAGVVKFESAKAKISTRKVESVEIADERIIPAEYMREKVTKAPAKTEIKKAIKAGTIVPGASIKEEKRITVK